MDPTSEEEAPGSRFDAALNQSPDFTSAGQATVAGEKGVLLTKHAGGADLDHCRPQVLIFVHRPDVTSHH